MRAAFVSRPGGPDDVVVGQLPDIAPGPGTGQALIRVRGAAVGSWDVRRLSTGPGGFPFIPGIEIAGTVLEAPAGSGLEEGDEIMGALHGGGGLAELATVDADAVAHKPTSLSFPESAALVSGAGAAYDALVDHLRLAAGETVLITAASGGVGLHAVQIARNVGATVLAVASARHHGLLAELGAAASFDYRDPNWARQVRERSQGGVDVLLDATGNETAVQALTTVRRGGRAICISGIPAQVPSGVTVSSLDLTEDTATAAERLHTLAQWTDQDHLRSFIENEYSLDEAPRALAKAKGPHRPGRVTVRI